MISTDDGEDALSFAARLHSATLLRYLLENTRPIRVRGRHFPGHLSQKSSADPETRVGHMIRLTEAAPGGESRFKRMLRHGERWITAAAETLQLLNDWHGLFPEFENFKMILLPSLRASLKTPYGMCRVGASLH